MAARDRLRFPVDNNESCAGGFIHKVPPVGSLFLIAAIIAGVTTTLRAQGDGCRDAYAGNELAASNASLLALQHQCELAIVRYSRPHPSLEFAQSKLALLRIHIALRTVTASDRRLPKSIDPLFAGDAAAILATIYKGKDPARYESAIIDAAWLAASSRVPLEDATAAIRSAILIYAGRGDYASAAKLIQHIEEPVLEIRSHNATAKFLIDLLQGQHSGHVRDAIANLVAKWGSRHVAVVGPIDYAIAETYKSSDSANYLHWLNVAEGNDYSPASVELNSLSFETDHQVVAALRSLGYDDGLKEAGDEANRGALLRNVAEFGAAALGAGLNGAYYTLQNGDLLTKLRILSGRLRRIPPTQVPGVGRVVSVTSQGSIEATGFLAYDRCTVVTALHALGGTSSDSGSLFLTLRLPTGDPERSRIRVVAMGKANAIPTSPANDWLIGSLEPCAPEGVTPPGLAEKDRSFDSTDNTFSFELDKNPVTYFAAGFPGGADEALVTVSPCTLSQRLGLTLAFADTCYLHGMSGGPVYASDPGDGKGHDVIALNTLLGETLDESIMGNASITSKQRGEGALAIVFSPAAWRASHLQSPNDSELSLVNAQVERLAANDGRSMSAAQRISFVVGYIESHVPPELAPFWYYFADLDKTNADAFLELTGVMTAETGWLPGMWCGDHQNITISADGRGHWSVENFEKKRNYGEPIVFGENIIFKSARSVAGDTDFIFRRRGADVYLAGMWEVYGSGGGRAENWVYMRTSKDCHGATHSS